MARLSRRARRHILLLLAAMALAPGLRASAFADDAEAPPHVAGTQRTFTRPAARSAGDSKPAGSNSWWLGTAGVALALAVCGWASVGARKYLPKAVGAGSTTVRVVGRTSLSPKHSVYLLEVGGRVLIVGAGPQGSPSLLGELTEPADLDLDRPASTPRFDRRLGDEA